MHQVPLISVKQRSALTRTFSDDDQGVAVRSVSTTSWSLLHMLAPIYGANIDSARVEQARDLRNALQDALQIGDARAIVRELHARAVICNMRD